MGETNIQRPALWLILEPNDSLYILRILQVSFEFTVGRHGAKKLDVESGLNTPGLSFRVSIIDKGIVAPVIAEGQQGIVAREFAIIRRPSQICIQVPVARQLEFDLPRNTSQDPGVDRCLGDALEQSLS
jgi:hypothetical protein